MDPMPGVDDPAHRPTGEIPPPFAGVDPADLDALAAARWGEGDHEDPHLPPGLLELGEAIEADQAGLL